MVKGGMPYDIKCQAPAIFIWRLRYVDRMEFILKTSREQQDPISKHVYVLHRLMRVFNKYVYWNHFACILFGKIKNDTHARRKL